MDINTFKKSFKFENDEIRRYNMNIKYQRKSL